MVCIYIVREYSCWEEVFSCYGGSSTSRVLLTRFACVQPLWAQTFISFIMGYAAINYNIISKRNTNIKYNRKFNIILKFD